MMPLFAARAAACVALSPPAAQAEPAKPPVIVVIKGNGPAGNSNADACQPSPARAGRTR